MFENIIGQRHVIERLATEVTSRILPPTLLFHGPDYSGKSSTALELARILSCAGSDRAVPWRCGCRACEQSRHLQNPETVLVGGRYFTREIAIAADAVKRLYGSRETEVDGGAATALRYLLERSVRKLTRRFDPILWEGDEARLRKAEALLAQLEDALAPYLPGSELPPAHAVPEGIDAVVSLCGKLASSVSLDAVPVDMVRRLSAWVRLAPVGPVKVVIIENVERLQESSRNALLKTLEEPPTDVYFIMTTTRRGAVLATILSRARAYGFVPRDREEGGQVIERIFRDRSGRYSSLRDYFGDHDGHPLGHLAERFLGGCLGKAEVELSLLDEITLSVSSLGGTEGMRGFVEELSERMRELLCGSIPEAGRRSDPYAVRPEPGTPAVPPAVIREWGTLLVDAMQRVESLNLHPTLVLESLYYQMRRSATAAAASGVLT